MYRIKTMNKISPKGLAELPADSYAVGDDVMNEDGSVAGVKAETAGQSFTISAKSVIICTGGYAYNPELTALFTPELAGTFGIGFPGATGDGIIMASNVGAATTHTDDMMCVLKDYEIMAEHNGTSATASNAGFMSLPNMIMVGADGTRFVNEKDQGYMTQKLNSPIFDQMHKDGLGYVWTISDQAAIDATEGRTKRGLDMEYITADTVAELAEKMGVDAAGLEKTINDFNSYVDAGYDEEFGRIGDQLTAKLTAILRLANALDRSHRQKFKSVKASLRDSDLIVTVESAEDMTLEMTSFATKTAFFEEVYSIRPVLKQKKIL